LKELVKPGHKHIKRYCATGLLFGGQAMLIPAKKKKIRLLRLSLPPPLEREGEGYKANPPKLI